MAVYQKKGLSYLYGCGKIFVKGEVKMSIKDRIFHSNIIIMAISLILLLAVVIFSTSYFLKKGNEEDNADLIDNSIENIIYMFEYNIPLSADYSTLSLTCRKSGYSLIININGENVFISDEKAPSRLEELNLPDNISMKSTVVYSLSDVTVVVKKFNISGDMYSFYAISTPKQEDGILFAQVLPFVLIIGFFAILILLIVNRILTKRLVDKIMIPINKLNEGAMRISIDNLDVPVEYTGEIEFERVCRTFNEMQKAIKENRTKMVAYEQSRTDMVTGISHDLRTPLTSIKGYVKGILDGVADTPKKRTEYLSIIYSTAEDMNMLLDKLFTFSKVETGKMPFKFIRFNIGEYIEKYVAERETVLLDKGVQIKAYVPPRLSENLYDIDQIKRVLDNLVENTMKYAGKEKIKIDIYISETDKSQIIIFGDDGCGVEEEKIPLIFTRFYRCDEARTMEGNGVGLYIVKYIVEAHKGKIQAVNDKGLKIIMEFPKGENKN